MTQEVGTATALESRSPHSPTFASVVGDLPDRPLQLLREWYATARALGVVTPEYVTLATADRTGAPSSRIVQLLEIEPDALVFCTNLGSRKGVEIAATGRAAVSVYWPGVERSVNLSGVVEIAADDENDRRFRAEPRVVQAARSVSFHGRALDDEQAQRAAFDDLASRADPLPRPAYWAWFRVRPDSATFWEPGAGSLNRRVHYARSADGWTHGRIQA
ncbi:pyridoxal 5'-phosphate synthase [uncultured Amnibacterium sp.]|uniref:pyridoxine/pyridoxamine 5'-phosphate oxidase n=1 Tax=uncultured Amnibacterium sp. TaxID=1631851 RepID=UPI0035CB9E33